MFHFRGLHFVLVSLFCWECTKTQLFSESQHWNDFAETEICYNGSWGAFNREGVFIQLIMVSANIFVG